MLSSFEDRLGRLEATILPVYHETESLQRCQQSKNHYLNLFKKILFYPDLF